MIARSTWFPFLSESLFQSKSSLKFPFLSQNFIHIFGINTPIITKHFFLITKKQKNGIFIFLSETNIHLWNLNCLFVLAFNTI